MSASGGGDGHHSEEALLRARHGTVRFGCTGCGKCCNAPPMMSLLEAFELTDAFLAGPMLRFSPLERDIYRTGHPSFIDAETGFRVYIELHAKAVGWPRARRCPVLLEDGKCGIYDRRPSVCRVVPFDVHLRPDMVSRSPMFDRTMSLLHALDCDWSDTAPVIVTTKGVVDPVYRDAYRRGRASLAKSQKLIMAIPEHVIQEGWAWTREKLAARSSQADILMPLGTLVAAAVALGFFDKARAMEILRCQIEIADRLMVDAPKRKSADERLVAEHISCNRNLCVQVFADLDEDIRLCAAIMDNRRASAGSHVQWSGGE